LKFAFPSAAIIPLLSGNISGYYWMLPRESENQYDVRRVNIGSGPFWVSDYRPSVSLTLRRNDGWYDAAKIYIDNLTQPIVPEYATGLAQFRSGGIYGSTGVGGFVVKPDDILQTKNDVPALNLFLNDPASQGNIIFFGWNPSFGNGTAFRDKRMRQALSMGIDRDLWIDTFYNVTKFKSAGIPMTTVWNSALTTNWPGGANYTGFFSADSSFQKGDPRLNDLLSKARGEFDEKKRISALQDLQKILADEMYVIRFPGSSNSFAMSWPVIGNANVFTGDL